MRAVARVLFTILTVIAAVMTIRAELPVSYQAEVIANAGNGTFAPYYISANRFGVLTQSRGTLLHAGAAGSLQVTDRLSFDAGLDLYTGVSNSTDYYKWDSPAGIPYEGEWYRKGEHPANVWLQQAYLNVKYRSLYMNIGMKDRGSYMLNNSLSSGDMIQSANARSIPQVRVGLVDFRNIPLTNGWLQIQSEVAFGIYCQNNWLYSHFNDYSGIVTTDMLYNYKRIYFRTNPEKRFFATFGAQAAGQFGGTSYYYSDGVLRNVDRHSRSFKTFWQMLVPRSSDVEGFYEGQHIGSWDIKLSYRLKNSSLISAYVENLWEDGSSMGKLNGFDGLWGVEYKAAENGWIDGAVVEYLQTTNQSGPLHWNPDDTDETTLNEWHATGNDNYYNNRFYGSFSNLGMAQGNPLLKSPIFYNSVENRFCDNRVRAFHLGISGSPFNGFSYRVLLGHRISWGTYDVPALEKRRATSFMVEGKYNFRKQPDLSVKGEFGLDQGPLTGDNVGVCVTVTYKGLLKL